MGVARYERQTPWTGDRALLDKIITGLLLADLAPPLVEIASGSGRVARAASELLGCGPWLAVDLEGRMLPGRQEDLTPVIARGEALPLKPASVGAVACWSGLHYIGAERALLECARVLRPGAVVVAAQKVADALREDAEWYEAVHEARSTVPREWYFSETLIAIGESCGLRKIQSSIYRRWQKVRLIDWASRYGYFDEFTTKTLLVAADEGRDPSFSSRTGFMIEGEDVIFPNDWLVTVWRK